MCVNKNLLTYENLILAAFIFAQVYNYHLIYWDPSMRFKFHGVEKCSLRDSVEAEIQWKSRTCAGTEVEWGGARSTPDLKCKEVVFTIHQCCFVCLILSSQGFILYPSIPCRPDWPGTHREPPASASCMLEFSVHPYTWRLFQRTF